METMLQDMRYALGQLAKTPGFTSGHANTGAGGRTRTGMSGILPYVRHALKQIPRGSMLLLATLHTFAQQPAQVQPPLPALRLDIPHSYNPFAPYRATLVPQPSLANSPRIDALIHNGVLELSMNDAIALALENNLDIAIARFNIPIAQADVLRTQAGGTFRGVNTGVVQNTPGGGVGGFGSGSSGAGAGGTSSGAGGAGSGASGLVQSTLGTGTNVSSYDPAITLSLNNEHYTEPLSNTTVYGVPTLKSNTTNGNFSYSQAFATGTTFTASFLNSRDTSNSPDSLLNPTLNSLLPGAFSAAVVGWIRSGAEPAFPADR